jgi:hypothetical protein
VLKVTLLAHGRLVCEEVDTETNQCHLLGSWKIEYWNVEDIAQYWVSFFRFAMIFRTPLGRHDWVYDTYVKTQRRILCFKNKMAHHHSLLGPMGGPNVYWTKHNEWGHYFEYEYADL